MSDSRDRPLRIGEAARRTGLPAYVLRYWETEFPQLRPKKTPGGQRLYRHEDLELLLRIKKMLYDQHLTHQGVRERLERELETGAGESPPTRTSDAARLVAQLRGELEELLRWVDRLQGLG